MACYQAFISSLSDGVNSIQSITAKNIKFERIQNYNSKIDRDKLIQIKYNPDKLPYSSKKISVVIEEQRYLNHLRAGDTFGEMALIKNETRNADVVVDDEECILGSVDKLDYKKIIKDIEDEHKGAVNEKTLGILMLGGRHD